MNKESDYLIKIIVYSNFKNVGVTSLILRYIDNKFIDINPTLEPDIFKITVFDDGKKKIKVQIFDCGFKDFKKNYLKGAHGFLVVYDITNDESFTNIIELINDIKIYGHSRSNECVLIVGNKSDLEGERKVNLNQAKDYFQSKGLINYFFGEVSCKSSINVNECFQHVINKTSDVLYNNISINNNNNVNTNNNNNINNKNNKKCILL